MKSFATHLISLIVILTIFQYSNAEYCLEADRDISNGCTNVVANKVILQQPASICFNLDPADPATGTFKFTAFDKYVIKSIEVWIGLDPTTIPRNSIGLADYEAFPHRLTVSTWKTKTYSLPLSLDDLYGIDILSVDPTLPCGKPVYYALRASIVWYTGSSFAQRSYVYSSGQSFNSAMGPGSYDNIDIACTPNC